MRDIEAVDCVLYLAHFFIELVDFLLSLVVVIGRAHIIDILDGSADEGLYLLLFSGYEVYLLLDGGQKLVCLGRCV